MSLAFEGEMWEPFLAYVESQGISLAQAVRECVSQAMAVNASDPEFAMRMRRARAESTRMAYLIVGKALRIALREITDEAIKVGVDPEKL